jgi:hypothetical protein
VAGAVLFFPPITRSSNDVLPVLKVKQGPNMCTAAKDHMAATAAVATIRSTMLDEFFPVKMKISSATVARLRTELDVIDEIGGGQP